MIKKAAFTLAALPLVAVALAFAQAPAPLVPANPTPGCTATPAELEANKKAALEFFRPGITGQERIALIDPGYIQHNPAFVKGGREAGMSDFNYFKSRFGGQGRRGGGRGGRGRGAAAGPRPPQGNALEVVTAECDIVTVIHKGYRQDPTAPAGTFYEVFTFDTFRVRNGKLVEHWDSATINPPAGGRGN